MQNKHLFANNFDNSKSFLCNSVGFAQQKKSCQRTGLFIDELTAPNHRAAFIGLLLIFTSQGKKKVYNNIEELQRDLDNWIDEYNLNRTHSGKYCFGKAPMRTFLDSMHLAKIKLLGEAKIAG